MHKRNIAIFLLFTLIGIVLLVANGGVKNHDRNALWKIAGRCADNQKKNSNPLPCDSVNLEKGYVVLKDKVGVAQYLLIPIRKISGIENLDLLTGNTVNYWQAAWDARRALFQRLGHALPEDTIAMAVNSSVSRSQDQLHIHIDCVKPEVRNILLQHAGELNDHWRALSFTLIGHTYHGRRIRNLQVTEPFHLLADDNGVAKSAMGLATLVAIGSGDGFILLYDTADYAQGDLAHGEDLLDHGCELVSAASTDHRL